MDSITSDRDYSAEQLAALVTNPAWVALREIAERKMDREFTRMAKNLMRGDLPSVAQHQYLRGFFAGMKFLLDTPSLEERKLAKALEREEVTELV